MNVEAEPVTMRPEPVTMRPEPVTMRPEPVTMRPEPVEGHTAQNTRALAALLNLLVGTST